MTFCIITHVAHGYEKKSFFAYSPYVREMNIWSKYVENVILVAPLTLKDKTAIEENYTSATIDFRKVNSFNFLSLNSIFKTLFQLPKIAFTIYKGMKQSDHIHLRCPGNMGLLGSIIQILFPRKQKTAKYAGNWDPRSNQPLSYRFQKWILNNSFLTKNMSVLVYGEWENSSKNIKPFFTASYTESEIEVIEEKDLSSLIQFVFVGSLTSGKNPLYAINLVHELFKKGYNVVLSIYGDGLEFKMLTDYISKNKLSKIVLLLGNKEKEEIKKVYQNSNFLLLPSKSEGWPKVVAEAMFWGCLPIATKVSCVPNMLDNGERGVLLEMDLQTDIRHIEEIISNKQLYQNKVDKAINWSRKYTLDYFESEIKKLLIK